MSDDTLGLQIVIDGELEKLERALTSAGRTVEGQSAKMDKATRRAERGISRLEAAFDPASKALTRY